MLCAVARGVRAPDTGTGDATPRTLKPTPSHPSSELDPASKTKRGSRIYLRSQRLPGVAHCATLSFLQPFPRAPSPSACLPPAARRRTGDDDALHLYRTNTGVLLKTLYSKKYGCSCVTFTHASQAVVYASKVRRARRRKVRTV